MGPKKIKYLQINIEIITVHCKVLKCVWDFGNGHRAEKKMLFTTEMDFKRRAADKSKKHRVHNETIREIKEATQYYI